MSKRKIFFRGKEDNYLAETLRSIRTNIDFTLEKKKNVIVFTSTIPKEGKSTISSNYAMSVALSGRRVLLIDCDMRRPRAHTGFEVEADYGLGDILKGEMEADNVIIRDIEKNLDLLPSNHLEKNVTELLLSKKVERLISDLKERYDLIVLDTPPLMVTTDAAILGRYSDGIVYVVGYGMVSKKELTTCKKLLDRSKVRIIGSIINKIDKNGYGSMGDYSYGYKYYEDYIGDGE